MEILVEETEEVYEILGILWGEGTAELSRMCKKAEMDEREKTIVTLMNWKG